MLLLMIFLHIVDDYYLQGWLANAKQKQWWEDNYPQELYKHDYIWALLMHSFSWAFMIMFPFIYINHFNISGLFGCVLLLNVLIHMFVDNLKANEKRINLIEDQLVHILQIVLTYLILI